jgi:hypothetical protein
MTSKPSKLPTDGLLAVFLEEDVDGARVQVVDHTNAHGRMFHASADADVVVFHSCGMDHKESRSQGAVITS